MERRTYAKKKFHRERILSSRAEPGPRPCVLVLDHLKAGFNIGKIFRTAQFFGARELLLVGVPWFDPAPAKGAFKQTRSRFFETFAEAYQYLKERDYLVLALDPHASQALWTQSWGERTAFVLGHEEYGLSFDPEEFPDLGRVCIPRLGQTQSLNVAVAASMALYEYVRRAIQNP